MGSVLLIMLPQSLTSYSHMTLCCSVEQTHMRFAMFSVACLPLQSGRARKLTIQSLLSILANIAIDYKAHFITVDSYSNSKCCRNIFGSSS